MMVRVDFRHEENRATVRCHLCGSVSGLVLDGGRFRCREVCPPVDHAARRGAMNLADYFLGLHRGLKLPAAAPAMKQHDLAELMCSTRSCRNEHEEVRWQGTPASACWVCDRPWSNC